MKNIWHNEFVRPVLVVKPFEINDIIAVVSAGYAFRYEFWFIIASI